VKAVTELCCGTRTLGSWVMLSEVGQLVRPLGHQHCKVTFQLMTHPFDEPYDDHVDGYCWHGGHRCDPPGCVRRAEWVMPGWTSTLTTSQSQNAAADAYASARGLQWNDVRVWERHIRPLTVREIWADWGSLHWVDQNYPCGGPAPDPPLDPPDDWEPGPDDPRWEYVAAGTPGAVQVWLCGQSGDPEPPDAARSV